jgi:heptosyltransferase-1
MSDILFIKTSSLGDVIHHMPAVTDARRHFPKGRLGWIVEEAFAPLVRLHPAVDDVIPVASRRWRRAAFSPSTWRDSAQFWRRLRERRYDQIIDTQGLLFKSALVARFARGPRHGYDADSIREPAASWFYDVRHQVSRTLHAITRNRLLTGLALGYAPDGAVDFGLDRASLTRPGQYGIFLHATARPGKEWPEAAWIELGRRLATPGRPVLLPWGSAPERARSDRIAAALANARVPDRQPLDGVAQLIAGASFVVGVDTGLLHLAAALGVPLIAIFVGSEPGLTGPVGQGPMEVVGGKGQVPSVEEVWTAIQRLMASAPA